MYAAQTGSFPFALKLAEASKRGDLVMAAHQHHGRALEQQGMFRFHAGGTAFLVTSDARPARLRWGGASCSAIVPCHPSADKPQALQDSSTAPEPDKLAFKPLSPHLSCLAPFHAEQGWQQALQLSTAGAVSHVCSLFVALTAESTGCTP